ncbi:hypothetical protein AVEN_13153-1, partial [Araneus ventricosus]
MKICVSGFPVFGTIITQLKSIEAIVRQKVQEALSPLTRIQEQGTEVRPQPRRSPYFSTVPKKRSIAAEPEPRATDLWRTS